MLYTSAVKLGELCTSIENEHDRHRIIEGVILNVLLGSKICEIQQIGILSRAEYAIQQELDMNPSADPTIEDLR